VHNSFFSLFSLLWHLQKCPNAPLLDVALHVSCTHRDFVRCNVKKLAAFCLLLVMSFPAGAIEGEQVKYMGGTVADLHSGTLGRLDTTSATMLTYEYSGNKFVIPYAKIDSFEYSTDVARHLGVLPAMVVAPLRKRQRRHFFRISYHDENNVSQVAVFEVPKRMPRTLLAVLQVRAPQGCKSSYLTPCTSR
jgi:hypothetical protein